MTDRDAKPCLTRDQILAIRDEHLPSQGESFDGVAFVNALFAAMDAAPAPAAEPPQDERKEVMQNDRADSRRDGADAVTGAAHPHHAEPPQDVAGLIAELRAWERDATGDPLSEEMFALKERAAAALAALARDGPIVMDELRDNEGKPVPCTMRDALHYARLAAKAEGDYADEQRNRAEQAERELAEAQRPCPHIVSSDEGTSYCSLAESQAKQAEILARGCADWQRRANEAERELAKWRGGIGACSQCGFDWALAKDAIAKAERERDELYRKLQAADESWAQAQRKLDRILSARNIVEITDSITAARNKDKEK